MAISFCMIGTHNCSCCSLYCRLVVYKTWVDIINNTVITVIFFLVNVLLGKEGNFYVCSV